MPPVLERLVGRDDALGSIERALDELDRGHPSAIELAGEAGIGKTRLLRELGARAEGRGHLVLAGAAAELERDLPLAVFVDALDQYVAGLEPGTLRALDDQVQTELASVLPSLWALARGHAVALQDERFRTHRAIRRLLELLAETRPLVLLLDDFHWADSGSVELLGALLRRPPAAAVLTAVAHRAAQVPERLAAALERAHRAGGAVRIELGALTAVEATELLGTFVPPGDARAIYAESGGNPFYLEQLARSFDGARTSAGAPPATDIGVPAAVAASLREELALLSPGARVVFEGAAVAGDPFEADLAAAAAATFDADAMEAIDRLLRLDLVRATDVPGRFRFRHPLVRRAAYEGTTAAWRVGAHERCAQALAARGVGAAERAHHVERSARPGDIAAVRVLREAGHAAARLAPESAAHWFAGALRLLPPAAPIEDAVDLMLNRSRVLAAAGHFAESHEAVLEATAIVEELSSPLFVTVVTACAGVERFLGRYELAHERMVAALRVLPEPASVEAAELLIELTLNEWYRSRYEAMHPWAAASVKAAKAAGGPTLMSAALAVSALAYAMTGPSETARFHRTRAADALDDLPDQELSLRPDAAGWLAIAEVYLDLYADADAHASRALRLARATGRGDPLHRLYPVLPRVWYVRGKLAEAAELLDDAIEAGRLLGSPPALAGNLFNRSVVALASGDLDVALATAEESVRLTHDLDVGFVTAWAGVRLAAVLLELGQPDRAAELLFDRAGGEELTLIPGGWRAYALELLTRCWLALGHQEHARRAAALGEQIAVAAGLPLATAWADRALAAVALGSTDTARAIEFALASADAADAVGAPIEAALSRIVAGRALAIAGQKDRAMQELGRASAALDACGAVRYREHADRELAKLGRRAQRTRAMKPGGLGIESLTERELEVARLVVDRKTNAEIASELFLSQKTVETHLRNVFNKMGVATRVALAHAVERSWGPASERGG